MTVAGRYLHSADDQPQHWLVARLSEPHREQTLRWIKLSGVLLAVLGVMTLRAPVELALTPSTARLRDLAQDFDAARALLAGVASYVDTPQPHPPFTALLFVPFAVLGEQVAGVAWLGTVLLLWLGTLAVTAQEMQWKLRPAWILVLALALLLWPPFNRDLIDGTFNMPMVFLTTLGWAALRRRRTVAAGLSFGAAAAIKLMPLVFLFYLLVTRRLRAAAAGGLAFVLLTLVSLPHLDVAVLLDYFLRVTPANTRLYVGMHFNASPQGLVARLFGTSQWGDPLLEVPILAATFPILWTLAMLLLLVYVGRRFQLAPGTVDDEFAFVAVSMLALSPIVWSPYFLFLVVPVAVWGRRLVQQENWDQLGILLMIGVLMSFPHVAVAATLGWKVYPLPIGPTLILRLPALGFLALFGLALALTIRQTGNGRADTARQAPER